MCDCKDVVNEKLKEHNTALLCNFFDPTTVMVETMKLDETKRGKRKYMFATFCPFCGSRIRQLSEKEPVEKIIIS